MKIETLVYENDQWKKESGNLESNDYDKVNVVFVFGHTDIMENNKPYEDIKKKYPQAQVIGCSTSGNIVAAEVSDNELTATAVYFEKSSIKISSLSFNENDDVEELSKQLIEELPKDELKHIFIMSDGLLINGSQLARGINKVTKDIPVTGGMAGDGDRFEKTYVIANDSAKQRTILAVGFYGKDLNIGTGCFAGWSEFGAERVITKSQNNVIYEIDGEPALELYKRYLGELANELPNSGLRFPLNIKENDDSPEVIRTLLAVNEEDGSITFAGDVPEGYKARLMKADIDQLIDGAGKAASSIYPANNETALCLVVSCVGRKIVMNYLIDDELEAVQEILGDNVTLTGFYSYGEFAPFEEDIMTCELHNQTMTLTTIYE